MVAASGGETRNVQLERASVEVPVAPGQIRRAGTSKVAHVRYSSFRSGAHGELRSTLERLYRRGAEGLVLDLRDNGGGLLNEAVLSASVFLSKGELVVSTDSRTMGHRDYEATGDPLPQHPTVVLINRDTASAAEILASALGDHRLATIVGTRSFGKGTFQEVIHLAAGGALDLTVGEYFTADGDLAGRQRDQARGQGRRRSGDAPGRGPAPCTGGARREDGRREQVSRRRGGALGRRVATFERRGRFTIAEPLFERGPQVALVRGSIDVQPGEIALVDFGPGGARAVRALGSAESARDVVAALLWDRGMDRGFAAALESEAADAAVAAREAPLARRDLTHLPTFTVDPATARDFDDAVSAETEGDGVRLWVHIADVAAHVRPGGGLDSEALRRGTSTYVPGSRGADASRGAERSGLQPCARGGPARRDRRDRARLGRRASGRELLPKPHPLGRAPRLRPAG